MVKNVKLSDIVKERNAQQPENVFYFHGDTNDVQIKEDWKKITPRTYENMVNNIPKQIKNILNPWLPEQGIAFIYAATGVGKTLFTLNIAYAIAMGGDFLRYNVPIPRKVLYVDGEMAYAQIHTRFMNIREQQGNLDFKENWNLLNPLDFPDQIMPMINTPEGQEFYRLMLEKCDAEVIIFDNLSSLCAVDENISEQWCAVQNYFISLRAQGKTVIVVHHSGKDSKGYRGTSRMLDITDTAISLQLVQNSNMESEVTDSKQFKIVYQKSRTFGGTDAIEFEVTLSHTGWQHQSIERSNTDRIIELIKTGMSVKDIANDIGVSLSYAYRIVKNATKIGLLRSEK